MSSDNEVGMQCGHSKNALSRQSVVRVKSVA